MKEREKKELRNTEARESIDLINAICNKQWLYFGNISNSIKIEFTLADRESKELFLHFLDYTNI